MEIVLVWLTPSDKVMRPVIIRWMKTETGSSCVDNTFELGIVSSVMQDN
jgi:hypothetical protein